MSDIWWAINGAELMRMLVRVHNGEDPDLVYAEQYANAEITSTDADGINRWLEGDR